MGGTIVSTSGVFDGSGIGEGDTLEVTFEYDETVMENPGLDGLFLGAIIELTFEYPDSEITVTATGAGVNTIFLMNGSTDSVIATANGLSGDINVAGKTIGQIGMSLTESGAMPDLITSDTELPLAIDLQTTGSILLGASLGFGQFGAEGASR